MAGKKPPPVTAKWGSPLPGRGDRSHLPGLPRQRGAEAKLRLLLPLVSKLRPTASPLAAVEQPPVGAQNSLMVFAAEPLFLCPSQDRAL